MSFSIKAYLGLETKDFNKGLKDAENANKSSNTRMSADSAKNDGVRLASVGKIRHQIANLAQTIASGGSATDALSQGLVGLAGSLKLGLGAAAGAGIAVVLIKQLQDAAEEAKKLKAEVDAIGQNQGSVEFSTLDRIQAQMQRTIEAADKATAMLARGSISTKVQDAFLEERFGGSDARSMAELVSLQKDAQQASDNIAAKTQQTADIEEERLNVSEKSAKLLEIRLKMEEEIGAAIHMQNELASHNIPVENGFAVAAAKRAAAIKEATLAEQERKTNQPSEDARRVLEGQVAGHEQLSQWLATELDFQRQIHAATESGNTTLAYNLESNRKLTREKEAQAVIEANLARHAVTLAEVAKHGGGAGREIARRALRHDDLSKLDRERGNIKGAEREAIIADRLRAHLGRKGIIPKAPDLAADFDKSQLLKSIDNRLANITTI